VLSSSFYLFVIPAQAGTYGWSNWIDDFLPNFDFFVGPGFNTLCAFAHGRRDDEAARVMIANVDCANR
jgi:hypothetical protein